MLAAPVEAGAEPLAGAVPEAAMLEAALAPEAITDPALAPADPALEAAECALEKITRTHVLSAKVLEVLSKELKHTMRLQR